MEVGHAQLARLTAGKAVVNTAHRWIPFFLPTLATAFTATTARLTTVLGIGEMAGLSTLFFGRQLDRGRERSIMIGSLVLVAASAILAVAASIELFFASYSMLLVGVSLYTVSGHTYLSRRVPYKRRARSIGLFEVSWALALLIGAPIAAGLINLFGWRAPFVAVAGAALVMAIVVSRGVDATKPMPDASGPVVRQRLTIDAWIVVAASASIAMAGLTTVVIVGTWLDESLGVSTGGIGFIAMAFGGAELLASSSSAAIADRAGPMLATRLALIGVLLGLGVMSVADTSLLIGAAGLMIFFLGFEFAIVTSFSIVSEAMPSARGRALAVNTAVGTVSRSTGIVMSGVLYEAYGLGGPAAVSATAGATAIVLLSLSHARSERRHPQ